MQKIGRNDKCLCGSGLKYKKCHGSVNGISDKLVSPQLKCVCGSGFHPSDCCSAFLSSPRRLRTIEVKSEFTVENLIQEEYVGYIYFAYLSKPRREWDFFRNFYLYGIEINGRFFRPKTLDFILEIQTDEESHWNIRLNLDFHTGARLKLKTPKNLAKDKLCMAKGNITVSKPLNKIETPYIKIIDHRYLRIFHHTSKDGYEGITSSKSIWASPYDLQGSTRELKKTNFTYFTDLPELRFEGDLFLVAMREKGQAAFRTDDESQLSFVEIYKQPAFKREKRLVFYIDINIIAPVPAIYHYQEGSQYVEFFHPHIFRIGLDPGNIISIEQFKDGWRICDNSIVPKTNDIFPIANGNEISDLLKIYQDRYIEP
ncbi:SEC-C domain-containing protein [Bacillaceae bacterium S4-13-58]